MMIYENKDQSISIGRRSLELGLFRTYVGLTIDKIWPRLSMKRQGSTSYVNYLSDFRWFINETNKVQVDFSI